jgi:hypothetical protein
VPRTEELAGFRIQSLPNRLELLRLYVPAQAEQLGATAMPLALNPAMLIVVIAVFEMPLGIPGTARHGPYRQHNPTLTLFEIGKQASSAGGTSSWYSQIVQEYRQDQDANRVQSILLPKNAKARKHQLGKSRGRAFSLRSF